MATAADSSSNHHSPRAAEFSDRRTTPWAKVVRGDSAESVSANHQSPPSPKPEQNPSNSNSNSNSSPLKAAVAAARSSSISLRPPVADVSSGAESPNGHNGNAGRSKKPAWNKPSKDAVVEVGPVMGAAAWPALSEAARASPKLPAAADNSAKTVTDVSIPVSQGPVITHPPNSRKNPSNHANTNSASNHAMPARQRPAKRGSGGGSSSGVANAHGNSGFAHPPPPPPPPPPFPVYPLPNGFGTWVPAIPDPSPRDPSFRGSNWDARPIGFVPQPHQVNDHRNSSRRGNFGPHPRGDSGYHNNFGSKRDHQERGHFINSRDVHMHQQQRSPMGLVRPLPPNSVAFTPQPVRPFANPMGFPEFVYFPTLPLDPVRGMPFISHAPHPMFVPGAEPSVPPLPSLIVNQIDYYFSDTNLIRDEYLRSNMDAQGWVPISLIANFPRVKNLTTNVQLILDSLRASSIVELQVDKVRRRNDWVKWISNTGQLAPESGSSPHDLQNPDLLSKSFQKMTVDDAPANQSTTGTSNANSLDSPENYSSELCGVPQLPNGEVTFNNS